MIDPSREPLLTLTEAAKLVPGRRRSDGTIGTIAVNSLWRWCKSGKAGIVLEHMQRPDGTFLTSAAALSRFMAALAKQKIEPRGPNMDLHEWAMGVLAKPRIKHR